MSFSIVNSKINIYTRPIQEPLRQEKVQQVVNEPQNVVISFPMQEQKQYQPEPVFVPQVHPQTISQPISLPEKRKPFQLKSRERFQARRRETPVQLQSETPVQTPQPSPVVQTQTPTPVQTPVVPLVQLPQPQTQQNQVENKDQFDEFGYSIDEI